MSQQSTFEEIPTAKKIPASAKILSLLGKTELIQSRYTVSVQPFSGGQAGIGSGQNSKIVFKMINSQDYVDLSTAYITFQSVFNGTALNHVNFSDNVWSWFSSVRTLVNDQPVEEIQSFNIWANVITYMTMSKSYYCTAGSFQGLYLHNDYLVGGSTSLYTQPLVSSAFLTQVADLSVQTNFQQLGNGTVSWTPVYTSGTTVGSSNGVGNDAWVNSCITAPGTATGGVATNWCLPCSGLLGLFSTGKLFPLRSVASVALELTLPTNIGSIIYDSTLPTSAPSGLLSTTLALTNIYLNYDCVQMSEAYCKLMDVELTNAEGSGSSFAINTVEVIPSLMTAVATGKQTYILSKGSRYLKDVWAVMTPAFCTAGLGIAPPSSVFIKNGFVSAQLVVNSRRFPQSPISTLPQVHCELQKSSGKFANLVGDSVMTYPKWQQDLSTATTNLNAIPNLKFSNFILGFNLDPVINDASLDLQGLNTLSAGFQIQLELNCAPQQTVNLYMIPHFTKVLRIQGGAIQILN